MFIWTKRELKLVTSKPENCLIKLFSQTEFAIFIFLRGNFWTKIQEKICCDAFIIRIHLNEITQDFVQLKELKNYENCNSGSLPVVACLTLNQVVITDNFYENNSHFYTFLPVEMKVDILFYGTRLLKIKSEITISSRRVFWTSTLDYSF